MEISELKLSVRTEGILKELGIKCTNELVKYTPGNLANARGWGKKCLTELRISLLRHGLCLSGDTVVSSQYGLELLGEIPVSLNKLKFNLEEIGREVKDLLSIVEKIRIATKTHKD